MVLEENFDTDELVVRQVSEVSNRFTPDRLKRRLGAILI
jgi:hypothetical protein